MILKLDNFDVKFFPEFGDNIVPDVQNKVFFQAKSIPEDEEDDAEPIEFTKAELYKFENRIAKIVLGNIKHINNGRAYFSYTPSLADDESWFLKVYRGDDASVVKRFDLQKPSKSCTLGATLVKNTDDDIGVYKKDDMLRFRVQTNERFDGLKRNVSAEIWMKDIYVMKYDLDLKHKGSAAKEFSFSLNDRVYSKLPNGGVMVMKLVDDSFWIRPVKKEEKKTDPISVDKDAKVIRKVAMPEPEPLPVKI